MENEDPGDGGKIAIKTVCEGEVWSDLLQLLVWYNNVHSMLEMAATLQDPSALGLAFCLVVQYVNGGEMCVPCPGCECPQRRLHVRNVGQRGFG